MFGSIKVIVRKQNVFELKIKTADTDSVSIEFTPSIEMLGTPTQVIEWLLTRSVVSFAVFEPLDRSTPIRLEPDDAVCTIDPSVHIKQTDNETYVIETFGKTAYTGTVAGVIRFLIDLLPRHNEAPPRL